MIAVGGHYLSPLPDLLVRASCPFAGGVGDSNHGLCGALSGGVIVLGALWGRATSSENDDFVQELTRRYWDRFMDALGETKCQDIRDLPRIGANGCGPVVEEGCRILIDLIEKERAEHPFRNSDQAI